MFSIAMTARAPESIGRTLDFVAVLEKRFSYRELLLAEIANAFWKALERLCYEDSMGKAQALVKKIALAEK